MGRRAGAGATARVVSPLASKHPDGLMKVAEQYGFISSAHGPTFSLVPHYLFPGVSNTALATILAAVLGTLIVFGVAIWGGIHPTP